MPLTTRQQILSAAATVLRERGLLGTTTRNIAREAGLADGTLYVHFPHKEDLILATIQELLPRFTAAMQDDPRPLEVTLEAFIRAALQYTAALIPLSAALFADPVLLQRHQAALKERQVGPHLLYLRVAAFVQAEQQRGRINERLDPLGVAALLLGPCFHYAFLCHFVGADPLPITESQFVTQLVHTLQQGVAPSIGPDPPTTDNPKGNYHADSDIPIATNE